MTLPRGTEVRAEPGVNTEKFPPWPCPWPYAGGINPPNSWRRVFC